MTAMPGIASALSGKSTASLLSGSRDDQQKAQAASFLEALNSTSDADASQATNLTAETQPQSAANNNSDELWEKFREFVGNTLFGQTLASMRKTLDKPAYFHGGRAEEVFQQQLDQELVKHITEGSAETFIRPMYERFEQQHSINLQV